jgi:diguanylate cyclase (GGDEF)-like protein/PAS domain S-box-containing protein
VIPLALKLPSPAQLQAEIDQKEQFYKSHQEALERLQKIASRLPGAIYQFRLNPDGSSCFPYASAAIRDIYRLSPEELQDDATKMFAILHPEDYQQVVTSISESAQNLTPWQLEYRVHFADGIEHWLLGNAVPQRETDGAVLWHGFITDISERKASEQQLRTLSVAIEQSPASVVITDLQSNLLYVNPRFTEVTGYSAKEAIGKSPRLWRSGLTSSTIYDQLWDTLEQGKVWQGELINQRKNGDVYWENVHIAPVKDSLGVTINYVGINIDITERKNAEMQLQQSEAQFRNTFEYAPIGVVNISLEGFYLAVNQTFCDFIGYTREELLSMHILEITQAQDQTEHSQLLRQLITGTTSETNQFCLEKCYVRKDKTLVWGSLSIRLSYRADGSPDYFIATIENIDERKRIQNEILATKNQLQATLSAIPDLLLEMDIEGRFCDYHAHRAELLAMPPEQFLGKTVFEALPADAAIICMSALQEAQQRGWSIGKHFKLQIAANTYWFELSVALKATDDKQQPHFIMLSRDITERKRVETELRIAAAVFESQEGMLITDANRMILRVNKAFTTITGYDEQEMIGKTPNMLSSGLHDDNFYHHLWQTLDEKGAWQGELWNRRKSGEVYPEWLTITAVKGEGNQTITHYVGTVIDITERKATEDYINRLAFYDVLTQLPNRRLLHERLKQGIETNHRTQKKMAVLMLDLDKFKAVNDTLGHTLGDELLKQVAERIKACLRKTDMVARLGGDEFVVLMEQITHDDHVARIAENIISTLKQPFMLSENHEAYIGTSIGIAIHPQHGDSIEMLMDNADTALYHAKGKGRGCFAYFSKELTEKAHERIALEACLRHAIEQQQLRVYFQPQIDINSGQIIGAEALVRWHDPVMGCLMPNEFITLAEETGLIEPLGEWVLRETCRLGREWLNQGLPPISLAVNVSPYQFRRCDMNTLVAEVLDDTGFPVEYLELEITESGLMENQKHAMTILNNLHQQGVRLAIDDFGTGYSSLAYLKYFPIDVLKIDKTFIDDIPFLQGDMAITATIIAMAHHLGFKVLAEGVETPEQLAFLYQQGCDSYQGYLYSKALPADDFASLLASTLA